MTKFEIKAKQKALNYALYLLNCSKIRKAGKPSLKFLQRVLRSTCKTTLLNDSILTFRLKKTKISLRLTLQKEVYNEGIFYFSVASSKFPHATFLISACNAKELMNKINRNYLMLEL